jgi:hypothetical protein
LENKFVEKNRKADVTAFVVCEQCDQISLWKNRPKCCPAHFGRNFSTQLKPWKKWLKNRATSVIFKETTQRKKSPNRRKVAQSGHTVCEQQSAPKQKWSLRTFLRENKRTTFEGGDL